MAQHNVMFTVPQRPLGKADVEFAVKRDAKAFGRLMVSNGSVVWRPKNLKHGFKLGWVKFDRLIQDQGDRER